jgi:hypothetical protein
MIFTKTTNQKISTMERQRTMKNQNMIHWMWVGLVICLLDAAPAHAFYNPQQGRWLSRDPVGAEGGVNLYAAVNNDSINYADVLGLEARDFKIPENLKTCCDDKTIQKGEEDLRQKYEKIVEKLKAMGAKAADPEHPGNNNFSCKNSSSDILSFLTPAPKCWNCRVELRKDKKLPGDHQVVICRSYRKDNDNPVRKEIMFDWWGDSYGLDYKGNINKFRDDYPVFVDSPPNPWFTNCDGNTVPNRPPPPPLFGASSGTN